MGIHRGARLERREDRQDSERFTAYNCLTAYLFLLYLACLLYLYNARFANLPSNPSPPRHSRLSAFPPCVQSPKSSQHSSVLVMDQPRSRAIPSSLSLGNRGGNGTQPGRVYTHHTDTKRTSSSASTHELLDKSWGLNDSPTSFNRGFPPPPHASYDNLALPPRRIVTEKNRWVRIIQHSLASPAQAQPISPAHADIDIDADVRHTF